MRKVKHAVIGLSVLLSVSSSFANTPSNMVSNQVVDPMELATVAYSNPTLPFKARLQLTQWKPKQTKVEEVEIYFTPPHFYRMEFFSLNGEIDRIVLTNGEKEQVTYMKNGKAADSYTHPQSTRFLTSMDELKLLTHNYTATLVGSDQLIGRSVWVVELNPVTQGKPVQQLKIDKTTRTVLELKRSIPNENRGSLTRFIKFEPVTSFSGDLFLPGSIQKSDVMLRTELNEKQLDATSHTLLKLPGGFVLNGLDALQLQGTSARHFRYTDGSIPMSVFQTDVPVQIPDNGNSASATTDSQTNLSSASQAWSWQSGKNYFTLIGEVSMDLLRSIADTIK